MIMIPTWKTARIRPSSTCSSSPAPSAPPWKIARVRPSSSASFPSVPTAPPWQTPQVRHPTLASSPSLPSPPPVPDSPSSSGFQCPGSPPANFQPPGSPPVTFQSPKSPTVSFPPPQTGKGSAHVQRVLPVIEYVQLFILIVGNLRLTFCILGGSCGYTAMTESSVPWTPSFLVLRLIFTSLFSRSK